MHLVKFQPFGGFNHVIRRVNSMMNDLDLGGTVLDRSTFFNSVLSPNVEIAEDKNSYILHIELPGLRKEDIKVSLDEHRMLSVSGEKKQESTSDDVNVVRSERRYGAFNRTFTLPEHVDESNIQAKFENGVLTLSLPKQAPTTPATRQIEVA